MSAETARTFNTKESEEICFTHKSNVNCLSSVFGNGPITWKETVKYSSFRLGRRTITLNAHTAYAFRNASGVLAKLFVNNAFVKQASGFYTKFTIYQLLLCPVIMYAAPVFCRPLRQVETATIPTPYPLFLVEVILFRHRCKVSPNSYSM